MRFRVSDVQAQKREDYKITFGSEQGQRVLRDLMASFHMGRSTHIPGDSGESAFREGERHVVLHCLYMMAERSDPEHLVNTLDQAEVDYVRY